MTLIREQFASLGGLASGSVLSSLPTCRESNAQNRVHSNEGCIGFALDTSELDVEPLPAGAAPPFCCEPETLLWPLSLVFPTAFSGGALQRQPDQFEQCHRRPGHKSEI